MKDLIDERNRREKMQKSIVKYWNVNYSPVTTNSQEVQAGMEDDLVAETAENQMNLGMSGDAAFENSADWESSYEEDEVTRGQIDRILHEKSDAIRNIVENNGII